MRYYNTNNLKGDELEKAERKAETQESKILKFFSIYRKKYFAPHQIVDILFYDNTPLTSVRRAITNLEQKGLLTKTNNMIDGPFGKPVHTWTLTKEEK